MVVYTEAARESSGGVVGVNNIINLAIASTNMTYENSDIIQRINLVHVAEVPYVGSNDPLADLRELADDSDGILDDVHTWRDTYFADIVTMIDDYDLSIAGYCFIAWQIRLLSIMPSSQPL